MDTLDKIQAVIETLSLEEKQQLFLFLAERLHAENTFAPVRTFSAEQMTEWIVEDNMDMQRFRDTQ